MPETKPVPDFTVRDLLAELEAMLTPAGEGMRTIEIAELLGVSTSTALKLLHQLNEQGRLRKVRKKVQALDGRIQSRVAWRLKVKLD